MLFVAGGAVRRKYLAGVMNGAVVARYASFIARFRAERIRFLHVARVALFRQDGVRTRHRAAAVHAIVAS